MSDPPQDDNALFWQMLNAQKQDRHDQLAQARAEADASGKEPFDLDRFETLYDTTNETGSLPPRDERLRTYEHRYYLRYPELRTLEALAALMRALDPWK